MMPSRVAVSDPIYIPVWVGSVSCEAGGESSHTCAVGMENLHLLLPFASLLLIPIVWVLSQVAQPGRHNVSKTRPLCLDLIDQNQMHCMLCPTTSQ